MGALPVTGSNSQHLGSGSGPSSGHAGRQFEPASGTTVQEFRTSAGKPHAREQADRDHAEANSESEEQGGKHCDSQPKRTG